MKRRDVIKGMFALPVAGALGGCNHDREQHPSAPPSSGGGTLKIFFHGPFAVVVPKRVRDGHDNKVRVFVPFDAPELLHEFRFPTPMKVVASEDAPSGRRTQTFELKADGLEENGRLPYIDRGFDDSRIDVGKWEPQREKYFVFVELPMPNVITFVPPAENVVFQGGKPGTMPIDHILEYNVRDMSKVRIRHGEDLIKPLACHDVYAEYEAYWRQSPDQKRDPSMTQRSNLNEDLTRCTSSDVTTFFFGVGLKRGNLPPDEFYKIAGAHALKFFNDDLLGSFPNARDVANKKLQAIGGYVQPCQPYGRASASPMLMPAVMQSVTPAPQFRMVTTVEDCRAVGVIGSTG